MCCSISFTQLRTSLFLCLFVVGLTIYYNAIYMQIGLPLGRVAQLEHVLRAAVRLPDHAPLAATCISHFFPSIDFSTSLVVQVRERLSVYLHVWELCCATSGLAGPGNLCAVFRGELLF